LIVKCFLSFTGQDPRFSRGVADYPASRGVESIFNLERGPLTEEQLTHLLKDADGALAGNEHYTGHVMDSAPRLRIISRVGVGYESVDVKVVRR
jgi:D-3-phosphoglycerate dehydrogenase